MSYNKIFPTSLQFNTDKIPDEFGSSVYSEHSLRAALVENGQCIAKMRLKSPESKQFWIGTISKAIVDVNIVGWNDNNYIIKYNDTIYYLPKIHFRELMDIQTKKEASQ